MLSVGDNELKVDHDKEERSWEPKKTESAQEALDLWRTAIAEWDRLADVITPAQLVVAHAWLLFEEEEEGVSSPSSALSYFLYGEKQASHKWELDEEMIRGVLRELHAAYPTATSDTSCGENGDTPAILFMDMLSDSCQEDVSQECIGGNTRAYNKMTKLLWEFVPKRDAYVSNLKGKSFFHYAHQQGETEDMQEWLHCGNNDVGWVWRDVIGSGAYPELVEKCCAMAYAAMQKHTPAKKKRKSKA